MQLQLRDRSGVDQRMMRNHCLAIGLVCTLLTSIAWAELRQNPYESIALRNPFALRPIMIERPAPPPEVVLPPLPDVKLTGITDILGRLVATLQYEDRQTRKIRYSALLKAGEGDETVKVLEIDPAGAFVRVKIGQTETTLDFVRHGVQPSAAAQVGNPPSLAIPLTPPKPLLTREQNETIERRRRELQEAFTQLTPSRGGGAVLPPVRTVQ